VQIVLRLYKSPAEVLLGFDVDCVGVGYNGTDVVCLPRTRRAIINRYNIADPTRQTYRTNTYEYRLWKYSQRGFAVAVPGLVRKSVNPEVYTKKYSELKGFSKLLFFEVRENQSNISVALNYKGRWLENKGFKTTREDYNRVESLNTLNQDVISLLNDYNDGLLLNYVPGRTATDFYTELYTKACACETSIAVGTNIKSLCFAFGWSLSSIWDTEKFKLISAKGNRERAASFVWNIPQKIHFIGSLGEYIQSLPDVDDDWFKDVF